VRPSEEALDLSYSNGSIVSNVHVNNNIDSEYTVTHDNMQSEMTNQFLSDNNVNNNENSDNNSNSSNNNSNDQSGESSLSNFFR